ncbi:MAG: hypothetical protein PHP52_08110 [Bacteroidales bacterium]|nr:hypothetical protein [Bacteroidales bacterium]MDD4217384.1 hypothetical protein [Bacteroidales bacterium]MDY0141101.1 hypothetical protein [Bacteroidales bacterium]
MEIYNTFYKNLDFNLMTKIKIITVSFVISLFLYSCNNNNSISGTWKIIGIEQIDSTINDNNFNLGVISVAFSEDVIYELNENGNFTLTTNQEVYNKGTYTISKENKTIEFITTDGIKESLKYSLTNDKLILEEITGNGKITLQK